MTLLYDQEMAISMRIEKGKERKQKARYRRGQSGRKERYNKENLASGMTRKQIDKILAIEI